jgi:hypothetical protein
VGHNVTGTDKGLAITSYEDGIYTVAGGGTPTPIPTSGVAGPRLRFMFRFSGVEPGAMCAVNWPINIIAMGAGKTAVYNTVPQRVTAITDKVVFLADLTLNGFEAREGMAVFVRGPKQIQVKYAVDQQDRSYNAPGGQLSVIDENKVYDFTGHPMLAGDVTGTGGIRDGVINVLDFSQAKTQSGTHITVADGGYLLDDLDGNCQLGPNDVEVLKQSLNVKQDELY